ncbi:tripartite tricarboxylate transporter substrate binding protein [Bordetella petrii]|nr:tripartite tricarboxylate transporter substrate binding protein [Bordetella petrii]
MKIIVPFSPGALIDIIARIYAEKMGALLGQPVVVENKPGAGGMVGAQRTLAEPVDKNTMLFVSSSYVVIPAVNDKMPYDTLKDFSGIASIASSPTLVVANSKSPYPGLQELIDAARKPGAHLTYGSAGVNSATDLVGRYFNQRAGIQLEHIPYKGVQEGVAEVAAGRVDVSFPPIALALPFINSGQLKALAVTSPKRSSLLPDTPTVAEIGLGDFDYSIWYGVVMNARTASQVKQKLADIIAKVSQDPAVREQLTRQGLVPENRRLGEFDTYIAREMDKFNKILKAGN